MPTLAFATGFEHRVVATGVAATGGEILWSAVGTTQSIDASTFRSGSASLRINPGAATGFVQRTPAAGNRRLSGILFVRFASLPTGTTGVVVRTAATVAGSIGVNTLGNWVAAIGAGAAQTGPAASTGAWIRLDWDFNSSATGYTLDWRVGGAAQTRATVTSTAADITSIQFGAVSSTTVDMYIDDVGYSLTANDYPIPDQYIKGYVPESDGAHVNQGNFFDAGNAAISGANPAWDQFDVAPLSSLTEYVTQNAVTGGTDKVQVNFQNSAETNFPAHVQVSLAMSADGTLACNATYRVNDGGATANVFSGDPSQTSDIFRTLPLATSPSGGAWTDTAFDALLFEFGMSTGDVTPNPRCGGVIAEAVFHTQGVIAGAVLLTEAVASGMVYNRHPQIAGAVTVGSTVAAAMTKGSNYVIAGAVPVSPSVAAGLDYTRNAAIAGAVTVGSTIASATDYTRNAAISGSVSVGSSVAGTLDYTRNASIAGAVTFGTGVASTLDYTRNVSITGSVAVQLAIASGLDYTRNASLSGTVTVGSSIASGLDYTRNASITGSISVDVGINAALDYTRNASIVGAVTVQAGVASTLDYSRNAAITGAISIGSTIASGMAYSSAGNYQIIGAVTVASSIYSGLDYTRNAAIVGSIVVTAVVSSSTSYSIHPQITGALLVSETISAVMEYGAATADHSISGDISLGINVSGTAVYNRNASLSGTVNVNTAVNAVMLYLGYVAMGRVVLGDRGYGLTISCTSAGVTLTDQ